jgi:hypothetical protein
MTLVYRPTPSFGTLDMCGRDSQTLVSSGTLREHGSIFTHSPVPWLPVPRTGSPPKRYLVENVQQN